MSRMRFGQSAADADTLTRARPLATSTESVSCHTEENLGVDQWYKSMSRSPPATAVHVRKNFLAAGPHTILYLHAWSTQYIQYLEEWRSGTFWGRRGTPTLTCPKCSAGPTRRFSWCNSTGWPTPAGHKVRTLTRSRWPGLLLFPCKSLLKRERARAGESCVHGALCVSRAARKPRNFSAHPPVGISPPVAGRRNFEVAARFWRAPCRKIRSGRPIPAPGPRARF
eukprot:COSAG06_NODE_6912_length_2719_cov_123.058779_2_plen_225_part_00